MGNTATFIAVFYLVSAVSPLQGHAVSKGVITNEIRAESRQKNCADIQKSGQTSSGVYTVFVGVRDKPLDVYCDLQTDGGGWLVFQRREDGSRSFYRNWDDYQFGFGDVFMEFWLGNIYLHSLTEGESYQLRVDMEDITGKQMYAVYDTFKVGSPGEDYELHVAEYSSGNAGDALSAHNGAKFSTHDRDNDGDAGNCASFHQGAGWYTKCYSANPNGRYVASGVTDVHGAIVWEPQGIFNSMKFMEMKVRPRHF